jgi:tRNA pseudouridine55 synthase
MMGRFDDTSLVTMEELADALAFWVEDGDATHLRDIVQPAERALRTIPTVRIAPSAAREVAHGAPVYAPGVLGTEQAAVGNREPTDGTPVVCYTPDGTAICLGELVGDPEAESGVVVTLERVLV